MTTAALPAGMVPPSPALRSLLWLIPLTALWTLLMESGSRPSPGSGVPAAAVRLLTYGLIAMGLLARFGGREPHAGSTPLDLAGDHGALHAVGRRSLERRHQRRLPPGLLDVLPLLPLAIFLPVIVGAPLLLLSKRVGQVLDAMPAAWLVALQVYRLFGSRLSGRRAGRALA